MDSTLWPRLASSIGRPPTTSPRPPVWRVFVCGQRVERGQRTCNRGGVRQRRGQEKKRVTPRARSGAQQRQAHNTNTTSHLAPGRDLGGDEDDVERRRGLLHRGRGSTARERARQHGAARIGARRGRGARGDLNERRGRRAASGDASGGGSAHRRQGAALRSRLHLGRVLAELRLHRGCAL